MGAKNTTVLLVEDEDTMRREVAIQLESAGFTTTVAKNGVEAFSVTLNADSFDVGIFDIDLPDVGGVWLAERLSLLQHVGRVVFFTATSHELSLRLARAHGRVISKAEGVDALITAIRNDPSLANERQS